MTRRVLLATATLTALLLSAGCRSAEAPARRSSAGNDCVFLRIVDNWRVLDDDSLLVWTSGPPDHRSYLVRLARPAPGLRFASNLSFLDANRDGQICGFGGDSVITAGPTSERFRIRSVERLSEVELEDLLGAEAPRRGSRDG